eukprot:1651356-Prorocentrum_lima.AAC.1
MSVNFVTQFSSKSIESAALSSVCGGGVVAGAEEATMATMKGAEAAGAHRWVANSVETEKLLPTPR